MLADLDTLSTDIAITADVAIVGGGAAGLTIARRLIARGLSVALLESGGLDHEEAVHALSDGPSTGAPYYPLQESRLRLLGGTTAIWGGRLAEFDAEDFQTRSWVPHSGWPIGKDDLRSVYDEAWRTFDVAPAPVALDDIRARAARIACLDEAGLTIGAWKFDTRFNRFTHRNIRDLIDHPRCQIWLHATIAHLQADAGGQRIRHLRATSLGGRQAQVRATHYVLAAGGIENARLLLAADDVMTGGLGNAYGQVGRYFMEHPHARGGRVDSHRAWALLALFGRSYRRDGVRYAALLRPDATLQRREGILNTAFTLGARQPETARMFMPVQLYNHLKHRLPPTEAGRKLWMTTKQAAVWLHEHIDPLRPWLLLKGRRELALIMRAEQAPNPDSRVVLAPARDALGMRKAELQWRYSDIDKRTVDVLAARFDQALRQADSGAVAAAPWLRSALDWQNDPLISAHPIGGYHHMGTTRMSASPRTGVVDAQCRVHGLGNLHVAGSSVFPTSGWANPTLTIVALAIRLADHLADALQRGVRVALAEPEVAGLSRVTSSSAEGGA